MLNSPRGARRPLWLILPAVWLLLLGLVGCAGLRVVDEPAGRTDPVSPAPSALSATGEIHDVAVTAVDFDPPLSSSRAMKVDRISLLAVVENKGNRAESRLVIEAKLFGADEGRPLIESQSTIDRLAPGESQVVKFHSLPSIPARSAYKLDVSVRPVTGEYYLANNFKTFRVELNLTSY